MGKNSYNLLLYLPTKHVFENFGGGDCPVAQPSMRACFAHIPNGAIDGEGWGTLSSITLKKNDFPISLGFDTYIME